MVLSQVCLAVLVVAVCAAAQTPTIYTYQDTNSASRQGATDQQRTLTGQRYKHAYGNSPVNSDRQSATGSLYHDYRQRSVYQTPGTRNTNKPTGYKSHIRREYYPRRQMYDGQDIPNPNYRPSYGYSQFFPYTRQPVSYGRYGVPYSGYLNPYSAGYRYPIKPTAPSYTHGKPSGYVPSVPYGQGAPYLRDVLYVSNSNDHRKPQNPPSNSGEGKGQGGAGNSRTDGSVQPRPNGNGLSDGRNPQSPQYGRYPDLNSNRNPHPSINVDLAALLGNNSGGRGSGASRQPSDIDIDALIKSLGNNSVFDGRPLRPASMDLGSLYASGSGIQGFNANPSSPPDKRQQSPGGAGVIYPSGGQQQSILPQRPYVQGAPQGVQGRQDFEPTRPSALPGRGNPRVPTPGGNNAAPQRYPQRNGQPENNGGIILTQEQVDQLLGQSGNEQGSPVRPGNQITVPYYGPSSGQPSAQPPTRERPNMPRPVQSGNNQRYPEENNQRQGINQGMPLTPRQQEVTVPYYGPTPGQPTRRPSQPGNNNRGYPQGGDSRYPQGGDQRYSQRGDPRYPQGSNPRIPQGGDPRYPQGNDARYPQGSDPRIPQGGDPRYPQGGDPRFPRGGDPGIPQGGNQRYPQGSDARNPEGGDPRYPQGGQRYPQGGDPRYPQGGDPRYPQGSDPRIPQRSDPRYPQGSDARYPQGSDPRIPQGGDPRYPQGGDPRIPQGGNQRYPQGSDARNPEGGDPRYPQGSDQRYPQRGDPTNSQGGDQRFLQGGDPRIPQGGNQRYPQRNDPRNPQGSNPRYPQGGNQGYPQGGDPRNPQGSGQGIEGVALTSEQIQNLFGQAVPGNPRQGDNNGESPRLTPGRQPTDKNSGLLSTTDGGRTQG